MPLLESYEGRQFLIFPFSQIDLVDFSEVLETSPTSVRKSIDGTKTLVKWDGTTPSSLFNLTNTEGPYTYSQIKTILATPEWTKTVQN